MSKFPPIVLCVEDDHDTREMLRVLLEDRGYGFESANNCADALKLIKRGAASLVLLDSWLPDGSGIDVCRQVRQFNRELPIVFFSGSECEGQCLSAGANAFITKPCPLDELFAVLSRFMPPALERIE
jgi:CheY-like chemotaxis protein